MKLKLRPLATQVGVITGATSGIGLVTARKAVAKRARLVLASRNEGALRFLADEINAAGGEAVHAVADVANEEDVRRIAATARQRFGILGHVEELLYRKTTFLSFIASDKTR